MVAIINILNIVKKTKKKVNKKEQLYNYVQIWKTSREEAFPQ